MNTSADFTEAESERPTMESVKKRLKKDPIFFLKTMWSEKFNLPPNDERLLQLRPAEVIEQVLALEALALQRSDAAERAAFHAAYLAGMDTSGYVKKEVRTDEEARSIADKPHLTGDPEWDAIELEMTDPNRPLLSDDWMRGG